MLGEEHAYLTSAAAAEEMDWDLLRNHAKNFSVEIRNVTEEFGVLGVMGPNSRAVLSRLTTTNLDKEFPWLSAREIEIANVNARALRVSYLGELGWELHVPAQDMRSVFLALEKAGGDFGLGFYGAYAANSMRLEKGYRGMGE